MSRRRANAKRKTRDVRNHRYVNNYVRFPSKPFNDPVYGDGELNAPLFKRRRYVSSLYLPVVSSLLSTQTATFAEIRASRQRRIKKAFPYALSKGIYDARFYNPVSTDAVASAYSRKSGSLVPVGVHWHQLGFSDVRKILTCVRRTQRKQVLHALGKTGKLGQKKPKWRETSYIHC